MKRVKIDSLASAKPFAEEAGRPETATERSARRAMQAELFATNELARGISAAAASSAMSEEERNWQLFLNYFNRRTADIDFKTLTTKITRSELNDVFECYVARHYHKFSVGDCTLYVRLADIDIKRANFLGESNLVLLERGVAPIGYDGKPMNLHHLTRRHSGVIVLILETFHQKTTRLLHLRSKRYMLQPKPLERREFNLWKIDAFSVLFKPLKSRPRTPLSEKHS